MALDLAALKTTLSATIRLVFLLTVPAAVWLAVCSRPVIALLYQHGRFGAHDTVATAGALMSYCVGLPAFAAVGIFTRTFYALGDTRTPVRASFVSVAVNIALNLAFMKPFGHVGLALATSLTSMVNLIQLATSLRRRVGLLEGRRMLRTAVKVAAASIVACGVCAAGLRFVHVPRGFARELVLVGALALVGGLGIYAMMKALRVEEVAVVEDLARSMRRRVLGR